MPCSNRHLRVCPCSIPGRLAGLALSIGSQDAMPCGVWEALRDEPLPGESTLAAGEGDHKPGVTSWLCYCR